MPESVNLPRFLLVDLQQNKITGIKPGGQALSMTIERERTLGDLLVLEGAEGAFSWTITIGQTTVRMTPSAVRIAELAIDKQPQTLLMPVSARRQPNDLPDELSAKISIEFYKDAADAVFKALVE